MDRDTVIVAQYDPDGNWMYDIVHMPRDKAEDYVEQLGGDDFGIRIRELGTDER